MPNSLVILFFSEEAELMVICLEACQKEWVRLTTVMVSFVLPILFLSCVLLPLLLFSHGNLSYKKCLFIFLLFKKLIYKGFRKDRNIIFCYHQKNQFERFSETLAEFTACQSCSDIIMSHPFWVNTGCISGLCLSIISFNDFWWRIEI